jgi:hypothetical protein
VTPLVIPQIFEDIPLPTDRIPAQRRTDHSYVTELAEKAGYVFYVDPGPQAGMSIAYWGPEIRWGIPQPALSTNFDAHSNVESLSFSYDTEKAKMPLILIQEPNTRAPIPVPIPNVSLLKPPLGAIPPIPKRDTRIYGMSKENVARALLLGVSEAGSEQDAVKGSGNLDVRRYGRVLRARGLVGVRGAGDAFDGLYFTRSVTSSLQRGSFTQSFELIRDGLLATVSSVPV